MAIPTFCLCVVSQSISFLVSVQLFSLMIKKTKNTGQDKNRLLAEYLKDKHRVWNYFPSFPFHCFTSWYN